MGIGQILIIYKRVREFANVNERSDISIFGQFFNQPFIAVQEEVQLGVYNFWT